MSFLFIVKENIVTMKDCHITSITTAVLNDSGYHPWEEFTQYQDLELIKLTPGVYVSIENLRKFDIKCMLLDHWEGVDGRLEAIAQLLVQRFYWNKLVDYDNMYPVERATEMYINKKPYNIFGAYTYFTRITHL